MTIGHQPKVLFVTHKHPPSLGGMQRQSFELVRNYEEIGNASLIAYRGQYPVWLFFVMVVPWVALKLLLERDIDVIHGNDGLMGLFLTPFLLSRRKLFITVHGVDVVIRSRLYQWWVRAWLRRFDGVIAVSYQTASACIERGISEAKVSCVLNACDCDWTDERQPAFASWLKDEHGLDLHNKLAIVSVGRPVPRKGLSWFASEVLPKLPDNAVYLLAGPEAETKISWRVLRALLPPAAFKSFCHAMGIGTDYIKLKEVSESLDVSGKLILMGALSRERLNQLFLHADIFAMPNLKVDGDFEGFGLVAQEAVYNGALCIAADVDGIPSAVRHDETGILLPSGLPKPWIDRISEFCSDPEGLRDLALSYQQGFRADDYSWADVALAYRVRFESAFCITETGSKSQT